MKMGKTTQIVKGKIPLLLPIEFYLYVPQALKGLHKLRPGYYKIEPQPQPQPHWGSVLHPPQLPSFVAEVLPLYFSTISSGKVCHLIFTNAGSS
jgi:hypothetical protein